MAFNPFGDLRNLSLQKDWGQGVFDKAGLTPGPGTKFFDPAAYAASLPQKMNMPGGLKAPTNPALPMNPVLPGLPASTPPPHDTGYGGTIGFQMGMPNLPPGGPHIMPQIPSFTPPPLGPVNPYGRSPTDRDYPFPSYLAMLGIGNNLLI